jgi:hypothetical protein
MHSFHFSTLRVANCHTFLFYVSFCCCILLTFLNFSAAGGPDIEQCNGGAMCYNEDRTVMGFVPPSEKGENLYVWFRASVVIRQDFVYLFVCLLNGPSTHIGH